jgi:hypothetical protein
VLFIDNPPADWRALIEKPIANTLDGLGIELIPDDPSAIIVMEEILETWWYRPGVRGHPR